MNSPWPLLSRFFYLFSQIHHTIVKHTHNYTKTHINPQRSEKLTFLVNLSTKMTSHAESGDEKETNKNALCSRTNQLIRSRSRQVGDLNNSRRQPRLLFAVVLK